LFQPIWSALIIVLALPLRLLLMLFDPLIQILAEQLQIGPLTPPEVPGFEGGEERPEYDPVAWGPELFYLLAGFGAVLFIVGIFFQAYRRFNERPLSTFMPGTSHGQGERPTWLPFRLRNPFAGRPEYGVETVRDLYKNVLVFGENRGVARAQDDTPYEYLAPLAEQYPAARSEFQALTDAYVATHYGDIQFTRADIKRLQAAWQKIKSLPSGPTLTNSPS
jgi:hypothetical protein